MRTKVLILILSVMLVIVIAGCSIIGITWTREPNKLPEPTLIPLQAPLRRVLLPVDPLVGVQTGETALTSAGVKGFLASVSTDLGLFQDILDADYAAAGNHG